ncbi:MAG: D-cysteine desulfhydrase family protein [Chloroflexi bacterium]|nr:D-cysteine desulfhydrase family protein [Chloroflexota bacterium]
MLITKIPRLHLGNLPTPLEEAPRLAEALGGPRLFLKRDDLNGFALGGNKIRKLEFLLADAQQKGADVIVTTGALQSNHARLTAAAARRLGLRVILVLAGSPPNLERAPAGNLLLDHLLGAEVRTVTAEGFQEMTEAATAVAAELRDKGHCPYLIPVGGSTPIGALGYVAAALELYNQLYERGLSADYIFLASRSGGTQAGLEVGSRWLGIDVHIVGISVGPRREELATTITTLATETAQMLGWPQSFHDVIVDDEYVGEGYGKVSASCREAIRLLAQTEGVFLDPIYSGKSMAGLIAYIRQGQLGPHNTVVFWHTGGVPALFAYGKELAEGGELCLS